MSIIISAHLDVCECKEHARIVLSDGNRSREFYTREQILWELKGLLRLGRITLEEHLFLTSCVHDTELPQDDDGASLATAITCEFINSLDEEDDSEDSEASIH